MSDAAGAVANAYVARLEELNGALQDDLAPLVEGLRGIDDELQAYHGTVERQLVELNGQLQAFEQPYQDRLRALDAALQVDLAPLRETLASIRRDLEETIAAEQLDVELPDQAEPNPPDERDWLFASDRDYFEQLGHYKARRNGHADDEEEGE